MPETFPGKIGHFRGGGGTQARFLRSLGVTVMEVQGPPRGLPGYPVPLCVPELWLTPAPCASTA